MNDERIICLLEDRSEEALEVLQTQYGSKALAVAMNILGNRQDAEEAVSEGMHILWNKIPPQRPQHLWAYFSRIVRNTACSMLDRRNAKCRKAEAEICLDELEGCLSSGQDPAHMLDARHITSTINAYLDTLDSQNRIIFLRRYFYFDSCNQIARHMGMTRGAVNTRLHRLREDLRKTLEKEEIYL